MYRRLLKISILTRNSLRRRRFVPHQPTLKLSNSSFYPLLVQNRVARENFACFPRFFNTKHGIPGIKTSLHQQILYMQICRAFSNLNSNDPYEILGVPRNAGSSEIKRKYYELAKIYHPDAASSESSRSNFIRISAAYEVLSNPEKRANFE